MEVLGIDIGGTGIKGAVVDVRTGSLVSERIKKATPAGARRSDVKEVVNLLIEDLGWKEDQPIGFGFPAVVKNGVCHTATNISKKWIGKNLNNSFIKSTGNSKIYCLNDADAAGIAEVNYNTEEIPRGTIVFLTIGTGIGSAVFRDGILLENTELGLLEFKGDLLERYASNKVRRDKELEYADWAPRLNEALKYIEGICYPELFILGGGISKRIHLFQEYLETECVIRKSVFENNAGIIGAALMAHKVFN